MIGKAQSKLNSILLMVLALVTSSALAVLASYLGATPIVAGIRLNHNETLVNDDDKVR